MPNIRDQKNERIDCGGEDSRVAESEGARARQRFLSDYAACIQHGAERIMAWFKQAPRPGFSKATVSAWRASLEARGLGSSSIIIRMSAIRKLAGEAVDNGLLARPSWRQVFVA